MPVLIILGVLALIIAAVLSLRVTLNIEYKDEVKLSVRAFFLKIGILPKKKKRVNYKKFTAKKLRRMLEKERKAELKKQEKMKKKQRANALKKKEKKRQRELERNNKRLGHPTQEKRTLSENLDIVRFILEALSRYFGKGIYVKVTRIRITVASDDAAKTAVMYGAASASVAWILEFLEQKAHLKYRAEGSSPESDVAVIADFTAEKPTADVKLSLRVHVWPLITSGVIAVYKIILNGANKKVNKK